MQHQSNGNTNKTWATFVGEELLCQRVDSNPEDPFVVAVTKAETKLIVGHVL